MSSKAAKAVCRVPYKGRISKTERKVGRGQMNQTRERQQWAMYYLPKEGNIANMERFTSLDKAPISLVVAASGISMLQPRVAAGDFRKTGSRAAAFEIPVDA